MYGVRDDSMRAFVYFINIDWDVTNKLELYSFVDRIRHDLPSCEGFRCILLINEYVVILQGDMPKECFHATRNEDMASLLSRCSK